MAAVAAGTDSVLVGFQGGEVVRWYPIEDETTVIQFGRDVCNDISRVLLEPKGFHALVTNNSGDSWYLNFQNPQAKPLTKLKGQLIEAVAWDPDSNENSTKDLIVGTMGGQILHVVIEGRERVVKALFAFDFGEQRRLPVCGVCRERMVSAADGSERVVLFVAAGCGVYAFHGGSLETLFQQYQGQSESAASRALVYEVPRDSPHGELHVDNSCVSDTPASARVLFWLTGVGILAATIRSALEVDTKVLESPPGLIPFPRSPKATTTARGGGSLVASLLPPPPPPAPKSMALTKFHVILLYEDRWVAVSRVTHELVQQQEWATSTYGVLRSLARDVDGERLWMCSEKHMFELAADREDRSVWSLLLRLERFDDALRACKRASHRARVLAAHADWLFRRGRLEESARKFAEANTVPFEHVALRFLRADRKAALLEYFRCRFKQCPVEDKVTRALLGVWAVEVALAHLDDLWIAEQRDKRQRAALEHARASLRELLRDCRGLDVQATIYHLLQSHGWLRELTLFAEDRRDFRTVILHHVSRREYASAIKKLGDFLAAGAADVCDLICRFAPVLFGAEPNAFVSLLVLSRSPTAAGSPAEVAPLSVLPAVYAPRASAVHRKEAVRYLEHVLRHHAGIVGGHQPGIEGEAGSLGHSPGLLLDGDPISGVGEEGAAAPTGRSWATGTAVLNALVVLYAKGGHGTCADDAAGDGAEGAKTVDAESTLLRFFAAQEGGPLFDPQFALRVCSEYRLMRERVCLFGLMGMHEEAVDVALDRGDVALAKHNACKPADRTLRQKLWLRIVENQAATGDVRAITGLIHDPTVELSVGDVLPYMSDSITIDAFQAEICECLTTYECQIETLRQEMDDHRRALSAFKEDLKQVEERCVVIAEDQVCEICGAPAIRERFYVFACKHCFHEACLRALVVPTLSEERSARLFALETLRLDQQAAAAGALPAPAPASGLAAVAAAGAAAATAEPAMPIAEVEDELDGLLADDCPLCGRLMIQTIRRPFIDDGEEAEAESWAIR